MAAPRFLIEACTSEQQDGWVQLRCELWPEAKEDEHRRDARMIISKPARFGSFIAYDETGQAAGFIEASLRSDYVNGTNTSPVGFVEGLYVASKARRKGLARLLVAEAERWAKSRGCREMGSDVLIGNEESHRAHRALGYEETDRVVYFLKQLGAGASPRLVNAIPKLASLDIARSIAFYERLGFTRGYEDGEYGIVVRDGVSLHFWHCTDERIPKETGCRVTVEGVDKLYAAWEPLGVMHPNGKLENKPWGMREFSVSDPDGNLVTFQQDTTPAA